MPTDSGGGPLRTRFRLAALLWAFLIALSTATRILLLVLHGTWPGPIDLGLVAVSGLLLDVLASLWLVAPFVLALTFVPASWLRRPTVRAIGWSLVGAFVFGMLFVLAAEVAFFEEFDSRFNFVAVNYLLYPTEVFTNIWESYPTGWILAGIAVSTIPAVLLIRRLVLRPRPEPIRLPHRLAVLAGYAILLAGLTWLVPSEFSRVTGNRVLDEIADNGPHAFWLALLGHDAQYHGFYPEQPLGEVYPRLQQLVEDPSWPGSSHAAELLDGPRPHNVVVVLEESLGAEFIGALGAEGGGWTPEYDTLTEQGVLWTNAYSTGNRTIRAIEATTLSIPPLPGVSLVQRARSESLRTLPEILREHGYQTEFVYGGRALFDGMGSYLGSNGVERIVDQNDFPSDTFHTAWGVADEAIFDRALTEMDRLEADGRPFYTLVLSVSNHRPYQFPTDHVEVRHDVKGRINAVRYADWALGDFLRKASGHRFFNDTLFVLMGDHGARVYGSARIPLPSYHVPILFLAPGSLPPERVGTLASSMDVAPTVLAWLGIDEETSFFGHPVLDERSDGRALMTHNNEIALLRDGRMAVLGIHGSAEVFGCDEKLEGCDRPEPAGSQDDVRLLRDAIAYYEGADALYRRNRLRRDAPPVFSAEKLLADDGPVPAGG